MASTPSIKVSIIVPAYNAHNTLADCLGSLAHQTLQDIEIIVVNDASTDDTLAIMQRCQHAFPNLVKVIDSKDNHGAGGARNLGIDAAGGEYLGFVDSDDYVSAQMYEKLYQTAVQGNYDMVDCGMLEQSTGDAVLMTGDNVTGVLDDEKRSILISGGGYLFTRIFKRELFENPRIRMRERAILEDADVLNYMFATMHTCGNVKEVLYQYNDTQNSASKVIVPETYVKQISDAMQSIFDRTHGLPNYEGIRRAIEYEITQMFSYGINVCLKAEQEQGDIVSLRQLRRKLTALYHSLVRESYRGNPYVKRNIPELDLQLLDQNQQELAAIG